MKKYLVIVLVFLVSVTATFAYLYQRQNLSHVTATQKVWIDDRPLISAETVPPQNGSIDIFVKIAEKFKPTVVNIHSTHTIKTISPFEQFGGENDYFRRFFEDFFGGQPDFPREQKQKSLGSGFIISEDGYIVTNHHVIDHADEIKIKLSDTEKESYDAKLVGSDKWTDIALLKINTDGKKLPVAPLGDSDSTRVGEWVAAIGHPFGYGHTVSHGIISAKERILGENGVSHPFNDYIQTDASINLGNSGGPLISTRGEVIGINVATDIRAQGIIGFAIPINVAKDLIPQFIQSGHAIRGFIGIVYEELTDDLANYLKLTKGQRGVVVSEVIEGNPADLAGIKVYDVIVEFNGEPVTSGRDLLRQVGKAIVGKESAVKVIRNGTTTTFQLKPVERADEQVEAKPEGTEADKDKDKPKLGMQVEDIRQYPGLQEKLKVSEGVIITDVERDGPADKAGLEKGDVIVEVDKKKISDLSDFKKAVSKLTKGKAYLFKVRSRSRGGAPGLVIIKVE